MSEEEMTEQVNFMVKEVKEFSRTLEFDHLDKAKNLVHAFNLA